MTTNTTNNQAASIDKPEFIKLLDDYAHDATMGYEEAYNRILSYIEPKIAQAREEAALDREAHLMSSHMELMDAASAKHRIEKAEADAAMWAQRYADAVDAGSRAESRLAEIQRGVEGLTRWRITGDYIGDPVEFITHPEGELVYLKYILALLQPEGQADTSGLPG